MQHITLFLSFSLLLISCGQNDTKQKELELKEREIALKEKEFTLRQNDSLKNKTVATTITTENKTNLHSDFNTFWKDFKIAVNNVDKDAVASMTVIPFKDKYTEELSKYVQGMGKTRTSNSIDEFKSNYNRIFTESVIKIINSNDYLGWEKRGEIGSSSTNLQKGDYVLLTEGDGEAFLFSKKDGIYKLYSIPRFVMTMDSY